MKKFKNMNTISYNIGLILIISIIVCFLYELLFNKKLEGFYTTNTNTESTNPASTNPASTNPASTNPASTNPASTMSGNYYIDIHPASGKHSSIYYVQLYDDKNKKIDPDELPNGSPKVTFMKKLKNGNIEQALEYEVGKRKYYAVNVLNIKNLNAIALNNNEYDVFLRIYYKSNEIKNLDRIFIMFAREVMGKDIYLNSKVKVYFNNQQIIEELITENNRNKIGKKPMDTNEWLAKYNLKSL